MYCTASLGSDFWLKYYMNLQRKEYLHTGLTAPLILLATFSLTTGLPQAKLRLLSE